MNLNNVLRENVLKEYKSNKSDAMSTTMEKKREDEDEDRLVNAFLESEDEKLTFVKRMLNGSKKRKKSNEIFVTSKAFYSIDHNNLLMNIEMFEFQKVRDNLRRLVRGYLHVELNLLKMNYQSNQWYLRISLRIDKFKIFHSQNFFFIQDVLNRQWVHCCRNRCIPAK